LALSRGGRRVHTSHFVVLSKNNEKGESRLGITVSARLGKAVVRNRVKRLLREFFRRRHDIPSHRDFVVIACKGAGQLSLAEVEGELEGVFVPRGRERR
jgi:ribonuclease P protein component